MSATAIHEALFANALFKGIPRDDLEQLALPVEECRYRRGEIIFDEGDAGENVYLVFEGAVRISKKGRGGRQETLTIQESGGFFGEMALLDGGPRSARATAMRPSLLGKLDQAGLYCLMAHSPESAFQFTRLMARQLRSSNSLFIQELLRAERLSLLGSMMGSIVHDFRSPVGTLSHVGKRLEAMGGRPDLLELGEITQESVSRMLNMIQELLDYAHGTSEVHLERTTVTELMDGLNREILDFLEEEGIEVLRRVEYNGAVQVDRSRIQRLLYNLVKNAREAMPDGGKLVIRVRTIDGNLEITIADNGCGIPKDVLPRVFDSFVTHGKSGGTGLGMSIAKSVAEDHGGTIQVRSEEGKGTACLVVLPLGSPRAEA
ncbi:MAG: ATP-binding protein [Verrucomicrobiota bacterium]